MAFLRLLILALIISSCYDDGPRSVTPSELIAGNDAYGRTYQIDQIEIELGTVQPHRCVTDNFITYYPNGTYEINEGGSKCDPGDPPGVIGTWFINQRNNQLVVEIGDSAQRWNIDEINENAHQITSSFEEGYRTYFFVSSR
ncbi:hypothetical protein [Ekhidna sp.]|uniref:hypothetical protein n=1 Tax=Ekhidna sp. TaxID=2608089 RepID=UPI003CCBFCDF